MARMLAKSARRHAGHPCRYAGRRGCTCYYFSAPPRGWHQAIERRQARAAEKQAWRHALEKED
ncbi:hypothetical protein PYK79_10465 [Streptomyces sp. ID05-04B]|uniref:hypothetical protein n=1 Tax=Streptomyces TaxID=1883 RepID=UPI0029C21365|nr:hypothetical protein [Streptomyces sp. ID05-04B]MDX5563677.1 hypothetical protein [Streptomyces sp. ID05-04B]